jgi:SMODS-associated and fused to various effectors sensor domain
MKDYNGLIIIKHPILREISDAECLKALPTSWLGLPRQIVEVKPASLKLEELFKTHIRQLALEQRQIFRKEIEPVIKANPHYGVLYFGFAPISLAIDLGYQFANLHHVEIFQLHHQTHEWYQEMAFKAVDEFKLDTLGIPLFTMKGIKEIVIRLSISHKVKIEETFPIISDAHEIDIFTTKVNEDAISSKEDWDLIMLRFKETLDAIAEYMPNVEIIHLFAAIPTGIAFALGTKISPNIHPEIQTYQHKNNEPLQYRRALLVKGTNEIRRNLTDEDINKANDLRNLANEELTNKVNTYLSNKVNLKKNEHWFNNSIPQLDKSITNDFFWSDLPALQTTNLISDRVDLLLTEVVDGFSYTLGKWLIADGFFVSLNKRLSNFKEIRQAIRLFLFHEGLHIVKHKLTSNTSDNIGSFPKILETADYQADVYAMINEYGFSNHFSKIENPKIFILDMIDVATETMWSFDDNGVMLDDIQIRRLNRYLIWYWQYIRIEKAENDINKLIKILFEKPLIEFNGLRTYESNNRFFYDLNESNTAYWELGVFFNNQVTRHGNATNMDLKMLVNGVRNMSGKEIKKVLRSFYER